MKPCPDGVGESNAMTTRIAKSLLLCGLIVSSLIAHSQNNPEGKQGRFGGPPPISAAEKEKNRIKIGLTVQQQQQLDAAFEEMGRQRQTLGRRMRELSQQRHELLANYNFDRKREKELRTETVQLYGKMMQLHTETDEKIRRIMTHDQFDRLQQMMREKMAEKMARDGNRPRRDWDKGRD